jgi:murein DD-endopeptidase MepM/ murein hydrolase activator NlpD
VNTKASLLESTTEPDKKSPETNIPATSSPDVLLNLCSPLAEHKIEDLLEIISSPYNPPPIGKDDRHQGVDFAYYNSGGRVSIEGEGVSAIFNGWVTASIENRLPYGNMIILETPYANLPLNLIDNLDINRGESIYHLYAHLSEPPIQKIGDWVLCGDLIGHVGKTGYNIPVAHLHLETRIGPAGERFMEMAYYDTRANEKEMANYELWRLSGKYHHFNPMKLFIEPLYDSTKE